MIKKNQILVTVFVVMFSLLCMRLIQLQIAGHNKFRLLAIENAGKTVSEPAPRGVIYDRYGKVLVESRPVFSVRVLPYVLAKKDKQERKRILAALGKLLGEKVELKVTATEPFAVKDNIPLETAIRIEEKKMDLDGIVVISQPVRLSSYGSVASHVIGYVGEIEAEELERLRRKGYRLGDIIGKDGIEKTYDRLIRGEDGGKRVEVDVYGTPLRILESLDPVAGPDVKLTVDLELQRAAEKALGKKEGAVVVLNPNNGQILAMANYPNYDPNVFSNPLLDWKWKELKKKKHPFMNRALAIYPPGSIFKVITLTAALEEGKVSTEEVFNCRGYYKINNRIAKCWLDGGHGQIRVREGLVWSCDVVFYELGRRLGPDLLAKYARRFGLGDRTGVDLPQEKKGNVPTRYWKEKHLKEPWYEGDSINYGIGQGFVLVSPLQMASVYAGIATGKFYKPYVVEWIKRRTGEIIYKAQTQEVGTVPLSPKNLELVRGALKDVVDRGTGVAVRFSGVPAGGKTGTAENPGKAHAWFICYAPSEDPEIVIAAFVAHGEHGDRASAYVARDILKWYKEFRLKREFEMPAYTGQYILQRGGIKRPYGVKPLPRPRPERVPIYRDESRGRGGPPVSEDEVSTDYINEWGLE